jgi:predicted PurR-regulated permease PerM
MKFHFEDKYKNTGLTAFFVIAAAILFFFAIYRFDGLVEILDRIGHIMSPFIYGLVMAYLMCPLYNFMVRSCMKVKWPSLRGKQLNVIVSKTIATVVIILVILGIVGGFFWFVAPRLFESIVAIAAILPDSMADLTTWITNQFKNMPQISGPAEVWIDKATVWFTEWVETGLIPEYTAMLSGISVGVVGFVAGFVNFIIGVIVCAFFINRKEIFAVQIKKLSFAMLNPERADQFLKGSLVVNRTFGGYINGKIIDSILVGLITFIFMSLMGWPYAALISVIIGVTDIIPFFGPYIGAIPSALLLLMVDPKICLTFVIFIFVLQMFDGYLMCPRILGGTTGLPTFWVLFAIIVGGGVFGFLGMVVGVPVFAVLYTYFSFYVNKRLEQKGLSQDSTDYQSLYTIKGSKAYKADKYEKNEIHE